MTEPATDTATETTTTTTTSPEPTKQDGTAADTKAAIKAPKKASKPAKSAKVIKPAKATKKLVVKKAAIKSGKVIKAAAKGKEVKATVKSSNPSKPNKKFPRVSENPYREASHYALAFDILASMGKMKPVSRKDLLAAFVKCGRDAKLAAYDWAVVLSPNKQGEGHRSSRKEKYYVERFENGFVRLHMA